MHELTRHSMQLLSLRFWISSYSLPPAVCHVCRVKLFPTCLMLLLLHHRSACQHHQALATMETILADHTRHLECQVSSIPWLLLYPDTRVASCVTSGSSRHNNQSTRLQRMQSESRQAGMCVHMLTVLCSGHICWHTLWLLCASPHTSSCWYTMSALMRG